MCGVLSSQRVLSGQLSSRNFLLRPPEPSPEFLIHSPSESVYIGKTKFLHVPFYWNSQNLVNPHICVVGITGSGKSYFVKTFITRASLTFGSNVLILDWAGEYADWVKSAGGKVVSFGNEGINLLDLGGATPHARIRQVIEALEILTDISSFPRQRRLTEDALERAYSSRGFSLHTAKGKRRLPTLIDVQKILEKQGKRQPESSEAARRIKNLLLSSGGSFSSQTISLQSLLHGLVCVDLHSLPMESLRSLAGLAILQFVKERMRAEEYTTTKAPKLFVVVDEAWKIASDERSDVVSIVREGRKYGFSLIVASQNPTDVHKSIFSNAGTVLCFRLVLASDRDYVRSSLTYSNFFERESHSLSVGQALVHLEFAKHSSCPRTFLLSRVEGEGMLELFKIRGDGMDLRFERGEISRRLLVFGLSDRQCADVLSEFERKSHSLTAHEFVSLLEKYGHGRAATVSFLRELGAEEIDLLNLFSSFSPINAGTDSIPEASLEVENSPAQAARPHRKTRAGRNKRKQANRARRR